MKCDGVVGSQVCNVTQPSGYCVPIKANNPPSFFIFICLVSITCLKWWII